MGVKLTTYSQILPILDIVCFNYCPGADVSAVQMLQLDFFNGNLFIGVSFCLERCQSICPLCLKRNVELDRKKEK